MTDSQPTIYFVSIAGLIACGLLPSAMIAWTLGFLVRRYAASWHLIDHPSARKSHSAAVPLGGGLAIWLAIVYTFAVGQLGLTVAVSYPEIVTIPNEVRRHIPGLIDTAVQLWLLLGAGTVLMGLGLADDRWGLSWQLRIIVQIAVAAFVVWGLGYRLTFYVRAPLLGDLVSIVWIVGIINSFNMLDNMDGLSAGVAAIAAATLAAAMLMTPDPDTHEPQLFVAGYFLVLLGALLGFLVHNRHPARLFMGDAGSYFIGFSVAVGTIIATFAGYGAGTQHAVLTPLCALAVPLYDTCSVVWIRLRTGASPFVADQNHFSHRLVGLGLTPPKAVRTIYLLTTACGMGALLLHRVDLAGAIMIMVLVTCVLSVIAILESSARQRLKR